MTLMKRRTHIAILVIGIVIIAIAATVLLRGCTPEITPSPNYTPSENLPATDSDNGKDHVHDENTETQFSNTPVPVQTTPHPGANSLSPPSLKVLRMEVKNNPHATPPSLLEFAARLAERMEAANSSVEIASTVFKELEACITNEELREATSVQALCLEATSRLSKSYPSHTEFKTRHETLRRNAPKPVITVLETIESGVTN
jgi:hypothetical protein